VRLAGQDDAEGIAAVLNAVVREGDRTAIDRTFTPAEERAFLRRLPARAFLVIAKLGNVVVGFQVIEPYAAYTGAMNHVATIGTYVVDVARRYGVAAAMSEMTFEHALLSGFEKLVAAIRSDNDVALKFYERMGFRPLDEERIALLL
jgi:L-amino acid N-acyltransferase YncA